MGLKHQKQASRKRMHGFERGRYLVGIVGKIVDDGYFTCSAHNLQPPAVALKDKYVDASSR